MNNYKPNPILLEESYRRSYYKFAAVAEIDCNSYLIDASLIKLRGWEVAIFPLTRNHQPFEIETDDPEFFSKKCPELTIIPRSIFLMAVKDKAAAKQSIELIKSVLRTESGTDIENIILKLNSNNALGKLNILASAETL